jgi:hypothetical protein
MLKSPCLAALVFAATGLACSPTTSNQTTPPDPNTGATGATAGGPTLGDPNAGGGAGGTDPNTPAGAGPNGQDSTTTSTGQTTPVVAGGANDNRFIAPEISHSKGVSGGIVVLYPRIIPTTIAAENAALASQIQAKMRAVAEKALPGRPIDVRPSPERVCPKTGCDGVSINVLFSRSSTACVTVAIINAPGVSPTKMIPWGGSVEFKTGTDTIQFRDMPENFIKIKDFQPCDQLTTIMADQDQFIEAALRAAAGGAAPATSPGATGTSPPARTPLGPSTITSKPAAKK